MKDQNQNQNEKKKHILLFGGCKCNGDVIETSTTVSCSMVKPTTPLNGKESNVGRRKHAVSTHRTSQWLNHLSIQETASL